MNRSREIQKGHQRIKFSPGVVVEDILCTLSFPQEREREREDVQTDTSLKDFWLTKRLECIIFSEGMGCG